MSEEQLLKAVGEIYDVCLDPGRLPEIGRTVRLAMAVESSIVFVCEKPSGRMLQLVCASENFTPDARADYARHYHSLNEWFQRAVRRPTPYLALGEELIAREDFERTEFCADWCSRVGIFHMIGGIERIRDGVVVGSGVHRDRRAGPFLPEEKRRYGSLMAHVGRAMQIADRLGLRETARAVSLELLEGLEIGLILLDADRRPLLVNASAGDLLRRGAWLTVSRGRIRATDPVANAALDARIGEAAETSGGRSLRCGGVVRLRGPESELPVLVAPFRSETLTLGPGAPAAVMIFGNPRTGPVDPRAIADVFGLTPAEARIVADLVRGKSLVTSAQEAGLSVNTAKTQLASVFAKTGHAKQAALVADVIASPVAKLSHRRAPAAGSISGRPRRRPTGEPA